MTHRLIFCMNQPYRKDQEWIVKVHENKTSRAKGSQTVVKSVVFTEFD